MVKVTKSILNKFYKLRKKVKYFRKYDFGFSLVVGGSELYSGAPTLAAMAALKTGVDMVRVIAPERAADIIASFSPAITTYPLNGKWFEKKHVGDLLAMVESAKAVSRGNVSVIIGGGLGRSKQTQEAILKAMSQVSVPMVIDADAIHALSKDPSVIKGKQCIATPHSYEFFVLTNREVYNLSEEEKIKVVKEESSRLGLTILLKDKPDIISDGKNVALNSAGSPYMSVGGTGDVLSGICGALLSRREFSPFLVAQAAAYISGQAGSLAAQDLKESLSPVDVINYIHKVLH